MVGAGLAVQLKALQLAAQSTVLYLLSILPHTRASGTSKLEMSSGICHEQTTFWRCTMRAPGKVTVGEDQSLAFISATVTLFIAAQVSYCFPRDDMIEIQPICVALPTTELVQGRPRNRTMDNESNGLGILQAPRNSLLVERQLSREWLNIWSSLF